MSAFSCWNDGTAWLIFRISADWSPNNETSNRTALHQEHMNFHVTCSKQQCLNSSMKRELFSSFSNNQACGITCYEKNTILRLWCKAQTVNSGGRHAFSNYSTKCMYLTKYSIACVPFNYFINCRQCFQERVGCVTHQCAMELEILRRVYCPLIVVVHPYHTTTIMAALVVVLYWTTCLYSINTTTGAKSCLVRCLMDSSWLWDRLTKIRGLFNPNSTLVQVTAVGIWSMEEWFNSRVLCACDYLSITITRCCLGWHQCVLKSQRRLLLYLTSVSSNNRGFLAHCWQNNCPSLVLYDCKYHSVDNL